MFGSQLRTFLIKELSLFRPSHSERGGEVVSSIQLHSSDSLHLIDEFVDGNQFAGAEVDRRGDQLSQCVIMSMPFTQSSIYMKLRV